jgi:hypothetical protein
MPQLWTTQDVAAFLMASMFLQTQTKSVASQLLPLLMPLMMHWSEHCGKMLMSWAEAAAASVRRAVLYFIMEAGVALSFCGMVKSKDNER